MNNSPIRSAVSLYGYRIRLWIKDNVISFNQSLWDLPAFVFILESQRHIMGMCLSKWLAGWKRCSKSALHPPRPLWYQPIAHEWRRICLQGVWTEPSTVCSTTAPFVPVLYASFDCANLLMKVSDEFIVSENQMLSYDRSNHSHSLHSCSDVSVSLLFILCWIGTNGGIIRRRKS